MEFKLLRVNLTKEEVKSEPVKEYWARKFIGGKGLGAAYLYSELEKGTDALSPKNKLLFMLGPLVGIAPGMTRYAVITKSPHTGTFLDSYAGGHFPAELRFALHEHLGIIFEGRAKGMVYLKVEDGEARVEDGEHLRNKTTAEVEELFKGYRVASIGPAGENLVSFACITNDSGRNAGRGGAGAVMGSKNLKAVVVRGDKKMELSDEVKELRKKHNKRLAGEDPNIAWLKEAGTTSLVDMCNDAGILPTENWTKGSFEDALKINAKAMVENLESRGACYLCPIACHMNTKFHKGIFKGVKTMGPEYETIALSGANTGVGDLSAIAEFNRICDELGLDTISTGATIAFAMECSKKGIIKEKFSFGDGKALVEAAKKIARREGVGNLLAEGVARAAAKLGGDALEAAVHVKGMELPGYDPRGTFGMALAYATSDRGACHLRAWPVGKDAFGELDPYTIEGKADLVIADENENSAEWSLIGCDFTAYSAEDAVEFLNAFTGYGITKEEYLTTGERIFNLTRLFNVREGFSRKDDFMPRRLEKPLKNGIAQGKRISQQEFSRMLDEYYEKRGWSREGIPKRETIERLDLKEFI